MNNARSKMRLAPASTPALALGIGGLIPFVGLAALAAFGPGAWRDQSLTALAGYGAVILSFVGALHWAYALKRSPGQGEAWLQYGYSVAPALAAWLTMLLPVTMALRLQAVGLLVSYLFDRGMARYDPVPKWFLRMRAVLTLVGAASLGLASL